MFLTHQVTGSFPKSALTKGDSGLTISGDFSQVHAKRDETLCPGPKPRLCVPLSRLTLRVNSPPGGQERLRTLHLFQKLGHGDQLQAWSRRAG